ncbi:MAG: sensor histidine kinase [Gammaproteobacteria bacterium]
MGGSGHRSSAAGHRRLLLPDFCAPDSVITVVVITELVAVVLALGRSDLLAGGSIWEDLARTSLFLLWIGLGSAAVLCKARAHLSRLTVPRAALAALGLLLAVTALTSEAGWWLDQYWAQMRLIDSEGHPDAHFRFLASNLLTCLIVGSLALRYFYVSQQWRRNVQLEATSRVNALQARIRPHFLFNSMNTIAALTRRDPALAEEAVEDLADLFRASLRDSSAPLTLKEEMEVARIYQRIEQLRLGDRLRVVWDIKTLPLRAQIPGLSLQPLLENAIYHGIEPRPDGGEVIVCGRESEPGTIELTISNPLPAPGDESRRQGNQIALSNITERFELAYDGRAQVRYGVEQDRYVVQLRFPRVEQTP